MEYLPEMAAPFYLNLEAQFRFVPSGFPKLEIRRQYVVQPGSKKDQQTFVTSVGNVHEIWMIITAEGGATQDSNPVSKLIRRIFRRKIPWRTAYHHKVPFSSFSDLFNSYLKRAAWPPIH